MGADSDLEDEPHFVHPETTATGKGLDRLVAKALARTGEVARRPRSSWTPAGRCGVPQRPASEHRLSLRVGPRKPHTVA